jgi:hypothetical protein
VVVVALHIGGVHVQGRIRQIGLGDEVAQIGGVDSQLQLAAVPANLDGIGLLADTRALLHRGKAQASRNVRVPTALLAIEQIGIEPGARAVVVRPPEGIAVEEHPAAVKVRGAARPPDIGRVLAPVCRAAACRGRDQGNRALAVGSHSDCMEVTTMPFR